MPVAMEFASFGKISFDTAGLYQATAELRSGALRMMMPAAPAEAGGVPGGVTSNWKVLRLPVVQALRPHCTPSRSGAPASRKRTAAARPTPRARSARSRSTVCDTSAQCRGGKMARALCREPAGRRRLYVHVYIGEQMPHNVHGDAKSYASCHERVLLP